MSREGTFEYQRDKYARMVIDILYLNRAKFGAASHNRLHILQLTAAINSYFSESINPKWLTMLIREYPDVFSEVNEDNHTMFCVNEEAVDLLDI